MVEHATQQLEFVNVPLDLLVMIVLASLARNLATSLVPFQLQLVTVTELVSVKPFTMEAIVLVSKFQVYINIF